MSFFARFTGKELAQSIDTYTNQYGEILVGMHHTILKHQQQLANLQTQMETLTGGKERYIQLLNLLEQHKETIEQSMDFYIQSLSQEQPDPHTTSQQLQEMDDRISVLHDDLPSIREQLSDLMKKHAEAVAEWSKKHSESDQDISSLRNQFTSLDRNVSTLSKQMTEFDENLTSMSEQVSEQMNVLDGNISGLKIQFKVLQGELKENARRWNENLKTAINDVQQTYNAKLSELQQMFQDSLKAMSDQYETKISDLNIKLLEANNEMENIHQQLEETKAHFQQQWSTSELKWKRTTVIFSSVLILFAIWEVYQYFQP